MTSNKREVTYAMTTFGSHVCGDLQIAKKSQIFTHAGLFDVDILSVILKKLLLKIKRWQKKRFVVIMEGITNKIYLLLIHVSEFISNI
jgi:hypothetical protein